MDRAYLLLQHWLTTNSLGRDGRLPPERVLATDFGVSRAELRKALAIFEADGRLVRHVGRGTFLVDPGRGPTGKASSGPDLSASTALSDSTSPRQALEARLAIEPVLARLAALNGTAAQMRAIATAAETITEAGTWEAYDAADAVFHGAVAVAACNPVLLAAHEIVASARSGVSWGNLLHREGAPTSLHPSIGEHAAILAALVSRDQPAAHAAARHHLLVEAAPLLGPLS